MWQLTFWAASLALFVSVHGIATECVSTDVCYSLSIPDTTASAGSGDIYVQISGPTTYSWIGVGQGTEMAGSNFMIIYADSTGSNVTLSPRLASGNVQPTYNSAARMTLLAGSGISDGVMTANILCSSCSSWTGGSADLSSSSTSWIYGFKAGNQLNSDSQSATIEQHANDGYGTFEFGSTAQGGSDSNPFLLSSNFSAACETSTVSAAAESSATVATSVTASTSKASTVTSSASTPTISKVTTTSSTSAATTRTSTAKISTSVAKSTASTTETSNSNNHGHQTMIRAVRRISVRRRVPLAKRGETAEMIVKRQTSSTCTSAGSTGNSGSSQDSSFNAANKRMMLVTAHATCACLAFAFFFPIGGILIRVADFNNTLWIHSGTQIASYILYTAAVGMGIWCATNPNSGEIRDRHAALGLFLFCLLFFQAPAGWMHHRGYKKNGGRTIWSHIHLWIGRVAITLGIINGGFGFLVTGTAGGGPIAYIVLATAIWIAYVLSIIYGEHKRRQSVVRLVDTQKSGPRVSRLSIRWKPPRDMDEHGLAGPITIHSSQERHEVQYSLPMPPKWERGGGGLGSHPLAS